MKIYHMAAMMTKNGDVSALCFKSPHPIDLKKAMWTIRKEAVSCGRCRKALAEGA